MAYITVDVDIDLHDFTDRELIENLKWRYDHGSDKEKRKLLGKIQKITSGGSADTTRLSLLDAVKQEVCEKGMHKKSLEELERFFNERSEF